MQVINLLQKLIQCKSITPQDDGAIDLIYKALIEQKFTCQVLNFEGDGSYKVKNLYARYGNSAPNLCFAGHTDVVPPGDIANWKFAPFVGKIENGIIYGRGVVDMKGAIAAMISAACRFIEAFPSFNGSISFMITGDEEAQGINGTKKVLKALAERNEKLDGCLVGEPTSTLAFGDTIKVGRRGSVTFYLKINGMQGHVAYPENADNPITYLIRILNTLKTHSLDEGNKYFDPSNLEVTTIDVGNPINNVIPASASAIFNIRFNNLHTADSLISLVKSICGQLALDKYQLTYRITGESFLMNSSYITDILQDAIAEELGKKAELSTSGGTSDARFIKDYCPVIEFGLLNKTAHKVDECSPLEHIEKLSKIYYKFLEKFFKI